VLQHFTSKLALHRLRSLASLPLRPRCAACAYACESRDAVLCRACRALAFAPVSRCVCCAIVIPTDSLAERCGACLTYAPSFDATRVAATYDATVRSVLHDFKFNQQPGLARWFAQELAPHARALPASTLLVPVPLSAERLRERGFNQSWEIAKHLSKLTHLPTRADAVLRTRHTPAQSTLKFKERRDNIKGAFACPARLEGTHIAVVDDVMTSGATLEEMARTLKKAGAASVTNLVVFRASLEGA
jgi:ComF family protein